MGKKIFMIAGEISGDLYAAHLAKELKRIEPEVEISGIGGQQMKKNGVKLLCESVSWGTIGFIEALKQIPRLFLVFQNLKKHLQQSRPDIIVLVDYPGFNMRIVNFARKIGIKTAYYVPPSKWARHPSAVRDAASKITKVIATYSTTAELYQNAGADVEMVGHPVIDIVKVDTPRSEILKSLSLTEQDRVIGLLPGSREREVRFLLPVLIESAAEISRQNKSVKFIIPILSTTMKISGFSERKIRRMIKQSGADIRIVVDRTYDVLSILDFAIITSGTATIEATCFQIPMIIIYKVSALTELVAKFVSHLPPFFGLPNIILKRPAVPEFLQKEVNSDHLAYETLRYLNDKDLYYDQKCALREVVNKLGKKGAGGRAAKIILKMIADNEISEIKNKKVGLIAGNGRFPVLLAQAAAKKGYDVVAVAISEEADMPLENVKTLHRISITNLQKVIDVFKDEGISEVLYAGKIRKAIMYSGLEYDTRLKRMLQGLRNRNDDSILNAFSDELARDNITVIEPTEFLTSFLPEKGLLTATEPSEEEWFDIKYAYNVAKQIAGMDIGQTVAVRNRAVLAIEAIEGTDEAILRAGKIGREGIVVAKVAKPNQDMRFDIPAIGLNTIEVLKNANVRVLAIDAGMTIVLDKEELLKKAIEYEISIVAL